MHGGRHGGRRTRSVPVHVVRVRHVRVRVPHRLVPVTVAVRVSRHRVVVVQVVPVVVAVRVFVLQRLMHVFVAVRLRQVKHHAGQHQQPAQRHQPAAGAVAHRRRDDHPPALPLGEVHESDRRRGEGGATWGLTA